jgi:hypothetical protein
MKQQYETAQKRIREEMELKNKFEQDLIREQQRIQDLTIQNEQQQKILKLKTEGLVAAQRKLRGASTTTTNFDTEMEKLIAERKELEILKNDIEKREELIQKRELLWKEKTELENKVGNDLSKISKKILFYRIQKILVNHNQIIRSLVNNYLNKKND